MDCLSGLTKTLWFVAMSSLVYQQSFGGSFALTSGADSGPFERSRVGSAVDATLSLKFGQGGLLLMGGGADVDAAFATRVVNHIGPDADVVVLRTKGSDAYNKYLLPLMQANSVETVIIDTREKANSPLLSDILNHAEFIWIAGGDQSEYIRTWMHTDLQKSIRRAYQRGAVIGGTSAGMAILSPIIYNPDGVPGVLSSEALADYCHESVRFSYDFVKYLLPTFIGDTHFGRRDRFGRLVNFIEHHALLHPLGIGIDEATSLFINSWGHGVVDGRGNVYILSMSSRNWFQSRCGGPTFASKVKRTLLKATDSYNLWTGKNTGRTTFVDVNGGESPPYQPTDPYAQE